MAYKIGLDYYSCGLDFSPFTTIQSVKCCCILALGQYNNYVIKYVRLSDNNNINSL